MTYYGTFDPKDLEASGPLQVALNSREYADGMYTAGPYDFDKNIAASIERAYQRREAEEIAAAKLVDLFEYRPANEFQDHGAWQISDSVFKHRYAFSKLRFGTSATRLDRVVDFLNLTGDGSKEVNWYRQILYPENIENQRRKQLEGLEFAPIVFCKAEWVDGSSTEILRYLRDESNPLAGRWSTVEELMQTLSQQDRLVTLHKDLDGAYQLELKFGKAGRFIDRIEYGPSANQLCLRAETEFEEIHNKGQADSARHQGSYFGDGFTWQVRGDHSQNSLPVPVHWKRVFFKAVSNDEETSRVFEVKNDESAAGIELVCDDANAPQLFLSDAFYEFRILWYSGDTSLVDMVWGDGSELEAVSNGLKAHVKKIDFKHLKSKLSLSFLRKNGEVCGPFSYRAEEAGLRQMFCESTTMDDVARLHIAAQRFEDVTQKAIDGFLTRGNSVLGSILKGSVADKKSSVRQIVFVNPLQFSQKPYAWAAVKKIRLGKSESKLVKVHDVEIPISTLIGGTASEYEPLMQIEIPENYDRVWYSIVLRNGNETSPREIPISVLEMKQYEQ